MITLKVSVELTNKSEYSGESKTQFQHQVEMDPKELSDSAYCIGSAYLYALKALDQHLPTRMDLILLEMLRRAHDLFPEHAAIAEENLAAMERVKPETISQPPL